MTRNKREKFEWEGWTSQDFIDELEPIADLIMEGRMFDFGYVYNGWDGASFLLSEFVANKNTDFESTYASKEKTINKQYDQVIEFFENYEG